MKRLQSWVSQNINTNDYLTIHLKRMMFVIPSEQKLVSQHPITRIEAVRIETHTRIFEIKRRQSTGSRELRNILTGE